MPDATVILPARNEGAWLAATLRSLAATPAGARFDVVVVDDGSQPPADLGGGCGLDLRLLRTSGEGAPAARNRGAAPSAAPALCFCDAHLEFTPGWLGRLLGQLPHFDAVCPGISALGRPGRAGFGFSWDERYGVRWLPPPAGPVEVPFLPGGCLAVRREAFRAVRGFDAGLAPWGHEDAEFSWALWLGGLRCGVEPAALVAHRFRPRHPYPVFQHQVDANLLRLGCVHFDPDRLRRLAAHLGADAARVARASALAAGRRTALLRGRRRDAAWLCARFALPL